MNRIRELRLAANMQQADLARAINVQRAAVSHYETGKRQLDPETICALCDLFGCTADYLLGRSGTPLPVISEADAELLRIYHNELPPDVRSIVDDILDKYRSAKKEKTGS